jgi:hypothetical protein
MDRLGDLLELLPERIPVGNGVPVPQLEDIINLIRAER